MRVTTGADIAVPGGWARGLSTRLAGLPRPAHLARALLGEAAAQLDRLFVWSPVAVGAGAAAYLGCAAEPRLWPALTAAIVLGAGAVLVGRLGGARALHAALTLCALAAAGFALAKLRSDHVAAPIVPPHLGVAHVQGWVVDVETPSHAGPRLLIAPTYISHLGAEALPLRIRIVMPPATLAAPGEAIDVSALLDPPPPPAAPGAYDFARDAWFAGEGGVGLARTAPTPIALPAPPWRLSMEMAVNALRWNVARRLAADLDRAMGGHAGDAVGLAIAVTTSHQDWLSQGARNDLRNAGLAHMLAIAGLHTAALSGFVFFSLRLLVAAWPWLALRVSGKKLAALGAMLAVLAYLVLSGAHPPARRAAITACVAFTAILLDRRAVSLRSLALAALIILAAEPEVVLQPGFEMSFCATASLVAMAEIWPRLASPRGLAWPIGWLQRGRDGLIALFMVSLVAGAATGPFAIQHFNRIASFGVFANLTADFAAAVVMMPALAVALLLELIGHGAALPALCVAGWAARAILGIAHFFANAPAASFSPSAAPPIALASSYLGILFVCLWSGRLRWIGLPFAAAVALWPRPPAPLIWLAGDGADAALALQGREVVLRPGVRSYATGLWAQRRGLALPADPARARGALFDCDYWSCTARAGVAPALGIWWTRRKPRPQRLAELCARSDILVLRAAVRPPGACRGALVLGPADFARGGAAEVFRSAAGWRLVWAQPLRGVRPWSLNGSGG
ncbi:MAG TPA: ComEC/Rec2 family competence protein [Caulobacteraceae bacterium]|nr:ComEC/Rec2 family competence protein [Caulobacteraceae bacterium]